MNFKQQWPSKKLDVTFLNGLELNEPTLVLDTEAIKKQYRRLCANLPAAKIYYAVKCNPEREILELLKSEGSNFEIASAKELDRLIAIGVKPSNVIFSNTVKIPSHITHTAQNGVERFAVDSPGELKKIAENAPGSQIYIRVQVSNHGSIIPLASKFGAHHDQVLSLATLALELGLTPVGLAFHVGSQAEDVQLWDRAFEIVGPLYKEAAQRNLPFTALNIGGGFPSYYAAQVPQIEQIAQTITDNLRKYDLQSYELWVEPGRYMVAEAGVLAATVIGSELRGSQEWIYLDVGRFNAFAELFESEDLRYPVLSSKDTLQNTDKRYKKVTLTGPTCDSFDTIFHNVPINAAVEPGDKIYFGTAGAYTHVYGSTFNDFQIPVARFV